MLIYHDCSIYAAVHHRITFIMEKIDCAITMCYELHILILFNHYHIWYVG